MEHKHNMKELHDKKKEKENTQAWEILFSFWLARRTSAVRVWVNEATNDADGADDDGDAKDEHDEVVDEFGWPAVRMILESETCSIAFENDDADEYSLPRSVVRLHCHCSWCPTSPSMLSSSCSDDFETRFSLASTSDSTNEPADHDLGRSDSGSYRSASPTPALAVDWKEHVVYVSRRKQTDGRQISTDRPSPQPIDTCRIETTIVRWVIETLENNRIEWHLQIISRLSLTGKSRIGTVRWLIPRIANRCCCRCVAIVRRIALLTEVIRVGSGLTGEIWCRRIGIEWIRYGSRREMTGKGVLIERREERIVVVRRVIGGGGRRRGRDLGRRTGSSRWSWGVIRHLWAWKIIMMGMIETISNNVNQTETRRGKKMKHWPLTVFVRESEQDERCSEDALRKLSRSIEEVRLHSQHRQICACICVLLVRSHSFLFFRTHTQKRPLVYVLRIIISFLSLSLAFSFCHFPSSSSFHWWASASRRIGRRGKKSRRKKQAEPREEKQVLLTSRANTYRRCGINGRHIGDDQSSHQIDGCWEKERERERDMDRTLIKN